MPVPEGWDANAAIEACPVVAWEGRVWRMHKRRYAATDPGGARKVSGRYNRGLDRFPEAESFPTVAQLLGCRHAQALELVCGLRPGLDG